jgi:hypothetical protein
MLVLPALQRALHAQLEAALSCQRALLLQRDAAAPAAEHPLSAHFSAADWQ